MDILAGTIWSGGTAQVEFAFDDRKFSIFGSTTIDFDMSKQFTNNSSSIPEPDISDTYTDPITEKEEFAITGAPEYDNFRNGLLYNRKPYILTSMSMKEEDLIYMVFRFQ